MERKYYVRSAYCGTLVDDIERTAKDADVLVDTLNAESKALGVEDVKYERIPARITAEEDS